MSDATEAPGFIARFGLVQYSEHLGARYPRDGMCEIGICRTRRVADIQRAIRRQADAERSLAQLAAEDGKLATRHAALLEWRPRLEQTHRRRRRELAATRRRRRAIAEQAGYLADTITRCAEVLADPPADARGAMPVFDHCHVHGWIRGLVCMACNNALIPVERGMRAYPRLTPEGIAECAALEAHLAKCPDCAPLSAVQFARVPITRR